MAEPSISAAAELDPEAEFITSKKKTRNEWEIYKENVRPLKRGRKVEDLNHALRSHADGSARKALLETRRRMIEAIDEYTGEDALQPWIDCIKWVQESFPTGGDCSGLVVIYEQCVRAFWNDVRYKDDQRYLKIWLEYAKNCVDAEVIYKFIQVNQIGQSYSAFYAAYALHMESKNKLKTADEVFNLGISRKAQPLEKLEAAYRMFLGRSMARKRVIEDSTKDDHSPFRSFGTILADGGAGRQTAENANINRNSRKPLGRLDNNKSLSIYTDENSGKTHLSVKPTVNDSSWHTLGSRFDRNKENISVPKKWTSYKVPQKMGTRTEPTSSSTRIDVFVDNECADNSRETELLKENPLRNFPSSTLR